MGGLLLSMCLYLLPEVTASIYRSTDPRLFNAFTCPGYYTLTLNHFRSVINASVTHELVAKMN